MFWTEKNCGTLAVVVQEDGRRRSRNGKAAWHAPAFTTPTDLRCGRLPSARNDLDRPNPRDASLRVRRPLKLLTGGPRSECDARFDMDPEATGLFKATNTEPLSLTGL